MVGEVIGAGAFPAVVPGSHKPLQILRDLVVKRSKRLSRIFHQSLVSSGDLLELARTMVPPAHVGVQLPRQPAISFLDFLLCREPRHPERRVVILRGEIGARMVLLRPGHHQPPPRQITAHFRATAPYICACYRAP